MAMVQEPVGAGGREDCIAGEQLRPVFDSPVGGEEDGATAVLIADQAEEQAGFVAGHWLEAHFVDDEQRDVEVFASAQPGAR